jgi:hypothetical protein
MLKRLRQRIQDQIPESAEEHGLRSMPDDPRSLNEFDASQEDDFDDSEDGEELDDEDLEVVLMTPKWVPAEPAPFRASASSLVA